MIQWLHLHTISSFILLRLKNFFMLSCSVFMGSESIYEKYQKFTVEEVSAWLIESGFPASTANKFKGEKVVYWILTLFSISNLCYIDYSIGLAVV